MIVKQIYNVDNKNKLVINLPEKFRKKKRVMVVIDDSVDSKIDKMELMRLASKDPLFLADIKEVTQDYKNIDFENL